MRRSPEQQGRGYAKAATRLAINYAFRMLNLYKLYLLVDNGMRSACSSAPST